MISETEYHQRLSDLQQKMTERGLDCFIVCGRESIYYFTGASYDNIERPFFIVVHQERQPDLLVPMLERDHMMKASMAGLVHSYFEIPARPGDRWIDKLIELAAGAKAVGIEPSAPAWCLQQIGDLKPVLAPLVEEMRIVKSAAEVDMIRRSAHYADMCIERMLSVSQYGRPAAAGYAETESISGQIFLDIGKEWDPLTTSLMMAVWAAPRSTQPHSVPQMEDLLLEGPHVAQASCRVAGYSALSSRTYFTADPGPGMKKAFEAMLEARRIAFEMVRPGSLCAEIDAAVNEFLTAEGYGGQEKRLHRTGHGFGLSTIEGPWLAGGSEDVLTENMVISIEPGIYLSGVGGFRHSDTVLVTAGGFEVLTSTPASLEKLIVKK